MSSKLPSSTVDKSSAVDDALLASFTPEQRLFVERIKAEAEARAEQERREKEAAEARAEQERRERQTLQQQMDPTAFAEYLSLTDELLFKTFRLPPPSTTLKSSGMTRVTGKFYPRHLRPWASFEHDHAAMFAVLVNTLGDRPLFPSLTDVLGVGRDVSPGPADEMDLRPFIRAAIEKPAVRAVSAYLEITDDARLSRINFQNNAAGLDLAGPFLEQQQVDEETQPPPAKRQRSATKDIGIPDRWCVGFHRDQSRTHLLVGEYKAAHKLHPKKLAAVLVTVPPGEDFFTQVITSKEKDDEKDEKDDGDTVADTQPETQPGTQPGTQPRTQPETSTKSTVDRQRKIVPGSALVARVLCQAYHYMITSGLEYGYVASGEGLVFLRVLENEPDTLFYFVLHVSQEEEPAPEQNEPPPVRQPHQTAAAHLASMCMLATRSTTRPRSWIDARKDDLKAWPELYDASVPPLAPAVHPPRGDPNPPRGGGGGSRSGGGSGRGGGSGGGGNRRPSGSAPKQPRPPSGSSYRGQATQTAPTQFIVELPTLPYCTQACLVGLCNGAPLDRNCPNVAHHREAVVSSPSNSTRQDHHPLTAANVCSRIVAQLAENMDKDCECLDRWGCYGRYGVLFKITVTGFGYTLVAKGVQAVHSYILEREANVYLTLADRDANVQGRLIPVFVGLAELSRPLPLHSCASVARLILLSYAGPTLASPGMLKRLQAAGVDCEAEEARTTSELAVIGLRNKDVRPENLTWNAEAGRVMEIDFDQAWVNPKKPTKPTTPETECTRMNMPRSPLTKRTYSTCGVQPQLKKVRHTEADKGA
ncbi:metalloprotease m41 [Sporothrix brasiliensis 5110]|uniref:Metalloprotease m41 n=1 Tax=Sporothrix brasiliensis 5110 TaxID=1398154 RepID=A0A0C2F350_9PEZI|nr:metalloprotease m41 [Sporothrix brasiliensis 5110]KIH93304.1 metalloprotease m41 [Sporothrix brasiliensis 5110]